ncbi:MAG: hypothetical protein K0R51_1974 [Cytophagaceae bacterium]|jgi:uncharacterized membrane protein YgdD (TMEM256/DUF423 family)|nr:hypothetical protein [Cytophagaceae bacterium]
MHKFILLFSTISGALSVAIGAFGAHKLKDYLLSIQRTETFETAVRYQFYHTLALLAVGIIYFNHQNKWLDWASYGFAAGILIFSGSLYILCATNVGKWGAVTPIGGLALIAGWIFLAIGLYKTVS